MVFGWNIKQIVKKKFIFSSKDKEEWLEFTKELKNITAKKEDLIPKNSNFDKTRKIDLHGMSLDEANLHVEKFILKSHTEGYKKLIIVTGKGLRSKSSDNPYLSEEMSILKNSVPQFIKNSENLNEKIKKISKANENDGGEGAFYIFLKN